MCYQAMLNECPALCNLDLSNSMVDPSGVAHLVKFVQLHKELECLNLARNRLCGEWLYRGHIEGDFDSANLILLLGAIAESPSMTSVDISRNLLGEDCDLLAALLKVMESPNKLQVFNVSSNNFDSTDRDAICSTLMASSRALALCGEDYTGSTISLSRRNLKPVDGAFICTAMQQTPACGIASLQLSDNFEFGKGGLGYLYAVLTLGGLTNLDVSGIGLGHDDCLVLASVLLQLNCSIQSLNIGRNGSSITLEGFQRIATALRHNNSLTSLDLSGSVPKLSDLTCLGTSIRNNKVTITVLMPPHDEKVLTD